MSEFRPNQTHRLGEILLMLLSAFAIIVIIVNCVILIITPSNNVELTFDELKYTKANSLNIFADEIDIATSSINMNEYKATKYSDLNSNSGAITNSSFISNLQNSLPVFAKSSKSGHYQGVNFNQNYEKVKTYAGSYKVNAKIDDPQTIASVYQGIPFGDNQFVTNKRSSTSSHNDIQLPNAFVQRLASKNDFNTFLANNTLTLVDGVSGNTGRMLVDDESDPGDPGVPVGDGIYILLFFVLLYATRKGFFPTANP